MKIAIIGQQDFGKAVLEAFLARGDEVAGVFVAPEKEGAKPDPLKVAAQEKGLKIFQFPSLKGPEAAAAMKGLGADIGIMAFVLQFAPQEFVNIPKHGTIQYHPSLLPKFRGPSSINWPISKGEKKTGLTIFRPTDGLDEGPVILQKETEVSENDTLGTVYFDRLFPLGVKAMLEAADLVVAGKHKEVVQDESQASYEGWFRANEAKVNWHNHVDFIHNTIRGADPGARRVDHDRRQEAAALRFQKHLVRTFGAVKGKIGEITEIGAESMRITAQGGQIEVAKVKPEEGKKISAAEWAKARRASRRARSSGAEGPGVGRFARKSAASEPTAIATEPALSHPLRSRKGECDETRDSRDGRTGRWRVGRLPASHQYVEHHGEGEGDRRAGAPQLLDHHRPAGARAEHHRDDRGGEETRERPPRRPKPRARLP